MLCQQEFGGEVMQFSSLGEGEEKQSLRRLILHTVTQLCQGQTAAARSLPGDKRAGGEELGVRRAGRSG